MGVIYMATNLVNGKRYVGKTLVSRAARWRQHCSNARAGVVTYLYKAMRKYGTENFTVEVIDQALLAEELEAKEIEWIARLGTADPVIGYNCTTGGDSGLHTAASRNRMRGRINSPEHRAKISAAKKGKPLSPEHRAKCALGRKGSKQSQAEKDKRAESLRRFYAQHPEARVATGIRARQFVTADGRRKMGEASLRRWATPEGRNEASARYKKWWADHPEYKEEHSKRVRQTNAQRKKPGPTMGQEGAVAI